MEKKGEGLEAMGLGAEAGVGLVVGATAEEAWVGVAKDVAGLVAKG